MPGGSQRRLGGLRGRAHGPAGRRQRHRRLDPLPGRPLRHHRHEADLRPRQPLRAGGLRQQPRPDRPAWAKRPKTAPCCWKCWPATTRWIPPRSTGPCRSIRETVGQPLEGLRLGLVREHFGEGLDAEVEAAVREAVRVYESLGAKVKRALAAAQQVRRGHVLHHCPVRGVEQPGPLRRRPLRLSHRREGR